MRKLLKVLAAILAFGGMSTPAFAVTVDTSTLIPNAPSYYSDSGQRATLRLHDTGDSTHLYPMDVRIVDSTGSATNPTTVAEGGNFYTTYAGARSTALVVKASPGRLVSIANMNTSAQTATFTCYDNASAASGTPIGVIVLGASQIVTLNWPAVNGITCIASAATLSGNGINISYD